VIRVFVVSAVRLYREGLCEILDRRNEIVILGMAAAGAEAARLITEVCPAPDVVLVDMSEPGRVDEARELLHAHPELRVVAITVPDREPDVIACAEVGIVGYATPEASLDQLVATIESAARDEMLCSPRIAAALVRRVGVLARSRTSAEPGTRLTGRELEIVRLIDEGLSNKQIAQRLCIELPTVKNHVHHILDKLGVGRRGEAAARLRNQLLIKSG
jgi:DNA-binding NarL/FixJ family response regulator